MLEPCRIHVPKAVAANPAARSPAAPQPQWDNRTVSPLSERINAALPQTQCTRCGYPDCASYAQAIAAGEAAINQCPPGGAEGVRRLSEITGQPIVALDPAFGVEAPRQVAVIDEAWCIGCTLCLPVCPTDAIMGSNKLMHSVIEPYCTGCELCIPVCPVDCISMQNVSSNRTGWAAWSPAQAETARTRYTFHSIQGLRGMGQSPKMLEALGEAPEFALPALPAEPAAVSAVDQDQKRSIIEAALARARAQREPKS